MKCDVCGKQTSELRKKIIQAENEFNLPTIPFQQELNYCMKTDCVIFALKWKGDFS